MKLSFLSCGVVSTCLVMVGLTVMTVGSMESAISVRRNSSGSELSAQGEKLLLLHAESWKIVSRQPGGIGIVLTDRQGRAKIGWLLGRDDKQYLALGDVFDAQGKNLSASLAWMLDQQDINPNPDANRVMSDPIPVQQTPRFTTEQLLDLVDRMEAATNTPHSFYQFEPSGARKHAIIGFYDPVCGNCADARNTFESMRDDFERADADVRWFPVAVLGTDNLRAATELAEHLRDERKGKVTPEVREAVDMNTAALLHSQERPAVPYFIWKGQEAGAMLGAPTPEDVRTVLAMFEEAES